MRTGLWISLVLLAVTIGCGVYSAHGIRQVSERYVSAAEELQSMTEHAEWARAAGTVAAYQESWEKTVPLLQMLINHEDTDNVTLSIVQLRAAIRAEDQAGCFMACAELRENAQHLYHRDAFTLGNVL